MRFIVIFEDPPVYVFVWTERIVISCGSHLAWPFWLSAHWRAVFGNAIISHGAVGAMRDQINEIFCEFHLVMRAVEKPLKADIAIWGWATSSGANALRFQKRASSRQCFTTTLIGSKAPIPSQSSASFEIRSKSSMALDHVLLRS